MGEANLGEADIRGRVEASREALLKSIETYYGPDENRKAIVEKIARRGRGASHARGGRRAGPRGESESAGRA
jgi:hypothetical protein